MDRFAPQFDCLLALTVLFAAGDLIVWLVVAGVVLAGLFAGAYFLFGTGPRRSRAFNQARRMLESGDWELTRDIVQQIRESGTLSESWNSRLQQLDGEALEEGGNQALQKGQFLQGLQLYRSAATLLHVDDAEYLQRVLGSMYAEMRRLFAAESNTQNTQSLIDQILALQPGGAEAYFWRGLCFVREGRHEPALEALEQSHQYGNRQYIDPPLYLGILLARLSRYQDSLKVLADANRIDSNCAFVSLQMGLSMVAGTGDPSMAVRVLQRALGPKGLGMWEANPARAWVEAFPQSASYIRRLSERNPFVCPLFGSDLLSLQRQGSLGMGQAHYRTGNFAEAVTVFSGLLDHMPPTLPLVRGLGLSLARLGRYDQAFRHLRAAVEFDPGDALTVGYFALCGACAKPPNPDDRPKNVAWAIRQIGRFDNVLNSEWANVCNTIHAEARALQIPISREDQLRLCNLLGSVLAHDNAAATAYDFLAVSYPDAVADEHAWLYGRAAQKAGFQGKSDLALLARLFRDRPAATEYYTRQKWSLDDVEFTYLERYAAAGKVGFPEVFGPQYAERGQGLLRAKIQICEQANELTSALSVAQVWLQLMPDSLSAHDLKARLLFRQGKLDGAVSVLDAWSRLAPVDAMPLVRRAIIEQQRGNQPASNAAIDQALRLTEGLSRARVAMLGARLAMQSPRATGKTNNGPAPADLSHVNLPRATAHLHECLREHPDHVEARWLLAALLCMQDDRQGLAAMASSMMRADVTEPRYHYLAAISQLLANQPAQAMECVKRIGNVQPLDVEGRYVAGWALLQLGQSDLARQAFQSVAATNSPSAGHARAVLGRLQFERGDYVAAIHSWNQVDPALRSRWQLDDPLRQTVYLAGLTALQNGDYEPAAERFREASKLGLRERSLGSLISLALFKAGQKLLYSQNVPSDREGDRRDARSR